MGAYLQPITCLYFPINWRCHFPSGRQPALPLCALLTTPETSSAHLRQIKSPSSMGMTWSFCFTSWIQKNFEKQQRPGDFKEIKVSQESWLLPFMDKLSNFMCEQSVPVTSGNSPHILCNQGSVQHLQDSTNLWALHVNHTPSLGFCVIGGFQKTKAPENVTPGLSQFRFKYPHLAPDVQYLNIQGYSLPHPMLWTLRSRLCLDLPSFPPSSKYFLVV